MSEPDFDPEARHVSPWSTREKIGRMLWYWVEGTIFRFSPRPMYRWRAFLLRCFGANVHPTARIRPSVKVEVPWHLTIGASSSVGDHAILYCLGDVKIGSRTTLSQYVHICAGTHDFTDPGMALMKTPITIEDDVWLAADVFVGPGVTVRQGCVVGARSSVFGNQPAWKICVGNRAKAVADRKWRGQKKD